MASSVKLTVVLEIQALATCANSFSLLGAKEGVYLKPNPLVRTVY
jgi:hypothetical protein